MAALPNPTLFDLMACWNQDETELRANPMWFRNLSFMLCYQWSFIGNQFISDMHCFSFLSKTEYLRKTAGIDRSKIFNIIFTDNPNVQYNSCYSNFDIAVK